MPRRSDRLFWIVIALLGGATTLFFWQLEPRAPTAKAAVAPRRNKKAAPKVESTSRSRFSAAAGRKRRLVYSQVSGDGAFKRLGEPDPGDWLYSFREPGQTIDEYAWMRPNRVIAGARETLHIQPFDDLDAIQRETIAPVRRHTALFFAVDVAVLPPRKVLRRFYDGRRRQYDADRIVRHLARRVPNNSLGHFGLMGSDLHALGLSYVFGEALLARRAGIYSLARFGREKKMLLKRALKLSAHEIGHMFGLKHCVFYQCVMNGVNSRPEMDRSPLHLCPVCLAKLQWNLKFEPVERYRALARFYRRHGLKRASAFVQARAAELEDR